jgi:hypothetical protein
MDMKVQADAHEDSSFRFSVVHREKQPRLPSQMRSPKTPTMKATTIPWTHSGRLETIAGMSCVVIHIGCSICYILD